MFFINLEYSEEPNLKKYVNTSEEFTFTEYIETHNSTDIDYELKNTHITEKPNLKVDTKASEEQNFLTTSKASETIMASSDLKTFEFFKNTTSEFVPPIVDPIPIHLFVCDNWDM